MPLRRLHLPSPLLALVALFALVPLVACDSPADPLIPAIMEAIGPTSLDVAVGTQLADGLAVRVLDEDELPVPGVEVVWTATEGELGESSSTTSSTGRATVDFRVGTTASGEGEAQVVTAAVEELGLIEFRITARPGPLARVVAEPDTLVLPAVDDTGTITTRAEDEYGNEVPTLPIALTSLDEAVATVDEAGLVRAVSTGETDVVARASTRADTVVVIVGSD